MRGIQFGKFIDKGSHQEPFDRLFDLFKELLIHTSGDVAEALDWMNEIDREHNITTDEYGMGDFIQDLKDKGFLAQITGVDMVINDFSLKAFGMRLHALHQVGCEVQ